MKQIIVTVSPTGEVQVETKGYTGSTCQQASQFIEQALGEQVAERKTGEFFQANEQKLGVMNG